MLNSFNKQILFDNIYCLVKEKNRRIGELENELGVSPGYISRTSKDGGAKPGIDFIVNVANALEVRVDTILFSDVKMLSSTERYIALFLEKLIRDTRASKLRWSSASAYKLNALECDENGDTSHPLIKEHLFEEQDASGNRIFVRRPSMISNSCRNTTIKDYCYSLKLNDDATLFLMDIEKSNIRHNDHDAYDKEIWICDSSPEPQFICSALYNRMLCDIINDVFVAASDYCGNPNLNKATRNIIDSFMNDN